MRDEKERKIIRLVNQIEAMKMCGNCKHMDIIDTFGGICELDADSPVCRNDYCPDWQLEEKINKETT